MNTHTHIWVLFLGFQKSVTNYTCITTPDVHTSGQSVSKNNVIMHNKLIKDKYTSVLK